MATKFEVLEVLGVLAACYPHFNLNDDTGKIYCRMLEDIPAEALEAAAIAHARMGTFFPSVAELVNASYDILIDELSLPSAPEAWAMVARRMSRPATLYRNGVHYVQKPMIPIIERAVDAMGGWATLRRSENAVADRARFFEAYRVIAQRERQRITEHPAVRQARRQLGEGRIALPELEG